MASEVKPKKSQKGKSSKGDGLIERGEHVLGATPKLNSDFVEWRNGVSDFSKIGFKCSNRMMIPVLQKIVISTCQGGATQNAKLIDIALAELEAITGQKPFVSRAKKSIAAFKVREGMPIALSVTLRKQRMYEFMERLISVALPRVRDFKGVPENGFDGRGNYSLGIREHTIFPEVDPQSVEKPLGLSVTFVTSARSDDAARVLLEKLSFPFRKVSKEAVNG